MKTTLLILVLLASLYHPNVQAHGGDHSLHDFWGNADQLIVMGQTAMAFYQQMEGSKEITTLTDDGKKILRAFSKVSCRPNKKEKTTDHETYQCELSYKTTEAKIYKLEARAAEMLYEKMNGAKENPGSRERSFSNLDCTLTISGPNESYSFLCMKYYKSR